MDVMDKVREAVEAHGAALEILGLLAAPRIYAARSALPSASVPAVRAVLGRFLDMAQELPDEHNEHVKRASPIIIGIVEQLPPAFGDEVQLSIVAAAREALRVLGVEPPDEGWDHYVV
jgi:hypothetical protein